MKKLLGLLLICGMFASCDEIQTVTPATSQTTLPVEIVNIIRDSSIVPDTKLITSGKTIYALQKDKHGEVYVCSTMETSYDPTAGIFVGGILITLICLLLIVIMLTI